MQISLLGTGAADGWPNPFCTCASCTGQRARGIIRSPTCALIDATVLLDLPAETIARSGAAGADLNGVRHVLVTHAHPDHLAPGVLLWRHWALGPEAASLTVAGPDQVCEEVDRWFGGDPRVRVRAVQPGDTLELGAHRVRAVAGAHEVPTLLYDVTGPDGVGVLYATDTGPLPEQTHRLLTGRAFDLVLLDLTFGGRTDHGTGHHDLSTFAHTLAALRTSGAVTPTTRVVAVHLGHHNPVEDELRATLAAWGAEPGVDGQTIVVPAPVPGAGSDRAPDVQAAAPSRTLLLGGARAGKSALAERLLASARDVVYVATGGDRPDDPDWGRRVAAHQARRPPTWSTVTTTDLVPLLREDGPPLLIDCLTLWLTTVLDEVGAWDEAAWASTGARRLAARVDEMVAAWRQSRRRIVAVSNEVGAGVVPDTWSGRVFRDEMGRLNARLAEESDAVMLVVAGRALRLR